MIILFNKFNIFCLRSYTHTHWCSINFSAENRVNDSSLLRTILNFRRSLTCVLVNLSSLVEFSITKTNDI